MKKILLLVVVAFAILLAAQVNAVPISLTKGDAFYVGSIVDGIPSNPSDQVTYINYLLDLAAGAGDVTPIIGGETYNREGSSIVGILPDAVLTGYDEWLINEEDPIPTIDVSNFAYVLGKYDAANAGTLVWYLGGDDSIDFSAVLVQELFTDNQFRLSHIRAFNPGAPIPEPATMLLLGCGLVGLAGLRRKFKKA